MRNILTVSTRTSRVYKPDVIPFSILSTMSSLKAFQEFYKFINFEKIEGADGTITAFKFLNGEVQINEQVVPISELTIETRRILLLIQEAGDLAEEIRSLIDERIADIGKIGAFKESDVIVDSVDTQMVAELDINMEDLYAPKAYSFMTEAMVQPCTASVKGKAEVEIYPDRFSFKVKYNNYVNEINQYGAMISPKPLVLEPRVQTHPNQQIFFISAPVDSITLVSLIEKLEKSLKK